MYPSSVQYIAELRETLSSQSVPQSTMIAERLVTLPTHELLSEGDIERICGAVQDVQRAEEVGITCSPEFSEGQPRVSERPRVS